VPGFGGVDSEVGRLRAVIVHRPGAELKRVLPGRGAVRFLCVKVSRPGARRFPGSPILRLPGTPPGPGSPGATGAM
jgi:hypothetical protein